MPVPTLEAPPCSDYQAQLVELENQWIPERREEYFTYGNEMVQQEMQSSYSENTVIIQVNPGETFTIQNEDGSYRNIPGPAQVPMISQNGSIPPIFVPPGYISQVIEENGVRRVVVVPSTVANLGDGNHALPATPFHHPPMHHIPFPMNGLHHNHMHPVFPQHFIPNCRPDTIQYVPRHLCIQEGVNNSFVISGPQYASLSRIPNQSHTCPQPCCQAVLQHQLTTSEMSKSEEEASRSKNMSPQTVLMAQHGAGSTTSPQKRVVCCAFSSQAERMAKRWPVSPNEKPRPPNSDFAGIQSQTFGPQVNIFPLQSEKERGSTPLDSASHKEYSSDSAYSSMRQSCPSETPPLDSPSCVSLQSSNIEYHSETHEHPELMQSTSHSPPGTSSMSPDSTSSLGSSPHGSPKASSRSNGRRARRSPIILDAEVCGFKPNLPPANLNNFPRTQQTKALPSSPELSENERSPSTNLEQNNKCNGVSGVEQIATVEQLLATVKKPKVHQPRPRSARVVWSVLSTRTASPALQAKIAKKSIRFDLHRRKESGKFESVYSGFDHQYTITDLRPATEYCLVLYANWDCERGPASAVTTFRTPPSYPDPPLPPKLQFKSKTYLVLRWTAPCENGEKIARYHVEVSDSSHSNCLRAFYTSTQRQFKVQKLAPAHSYMFRLAAENRIGKSAWSNKVAFSTGGMVPQTPEPPRLSKAMVRSLALHWSRPGPEVTGYILEMSPAASGFGFRTIYDGPDVQYTVKSLNRNSYYKFRLVAYSADERSHFSDTVSYCTCSDKPPTPTKPQVKGTVHPKYFKVAWDCPRECSGLDGLKFAVEMATKTSPMEEIYCGEEQECLVERLEPGHTYRLRLFCVTSGGSSNPSDILVVSTPPVPPGTCPTPTLSLRPQPKSLAIKWASTQSCGSASCSYEISCVATCDLCDEEPWIAYEGSDLEATIDDLKPGTKYSVAVRTVNKAGCGPWSEYLEAITSPCEPEKPEIPEATVLSSSSIHFQWSAPADNGAEISNYQLSWGSNRDSMTAYFTGAVLHHELQSLIPNTTYYYCIQAVNCIGMGPASEIGSARTCPSSPDQVSGLGLGLWDNTKEEDRGPVTSNRICIRWSKPCDNGSEILGYKVNYSIVTSENSPTAPSCNLIEVDEITTSCCIKDLIPDTTYSIRVCAFNMISCGSFSSRLSVRTKLPPPLPPRITCVSSAYNSLKLEWSNRSMVTLDPVYLLQIQDKYGRYSRAYKGPAQSHRRRNLTENTTYRFRIRTTDSNGVGNFSNEYAFTTPYQLPAAMEAPSVFEITESKCKVRWRKANEIKKDTIYYRLYLERDSFQKTFICDGTSYVLDYLAPNSQYRLHVCAVRRLDNILHILDTSTLEGDSNNPSNSSDLLGPPSSSAIFSTRPSTQIIPFAPRLTPFFEIPPESSRPVPGKNQNFTDPKPLAEISSNLDTPIKDHPTDFSCHRLLSYFMLSAFFIAYLLQIFLVSR